MTFQLHPWADRSAYASQASPDAAIQQIDEILSETHWAGAALPVSGPVAAAPAAQQAAHDVR